MTYEAIVLDLDGTTLTEFNTVPDELTEYVKKLRKRGLAVFIATGRTVTEARDVLPPDFQVDGMVTANGMAAFAEGEKIFSHALAPELVEILVEKAKEWGVFYEIHPNEESGAALKSDRPFLQKTATEPKPETVHENEWLSLQEAVQSKLRWTEELPLENIAKLYFFSRSEEAMDAWKAELEQLKASMAFTTASSTHHNVEATVEGISKATGVMKLLERFNIKKESIIVFGDGENDLPLFQLAGRCVAMKNAADIVKSQADEVTDYSYKENGLYLFLKKTWG